MIEMEDVCGESGIPPGCGVFFVSYPVVSSLRSSTDRLAAANPPGSGGYRLVITSRYCHGILGVVVLENGNERSHV